MTTNINKFAHGASATLALVAAAGAIMLASGSANAGGFAIREQSTEFQGMSFAGAAAGGHGLSSMYFNPATVTQHDGIHTEGNHAFIIPYAKTKNASSSDPGIAGGGNSSNIGEFAWVGSSYASYQWNDRLYFGLAVNAPFGLVTQSDDYVGSGHGSKSDIFNIVATPTVGFKLTDKLSIGGGVQVSYMKGTLKSHVDTVTGIRQGGKLSGDDFAVGMVAGLTYQFSDQTRFGIGYRSQMKHKLDGYYRQTTKFIGGAALGSVKNDVKVPLTTPDIVTASVRHQLTPELALLGSVEWANWSNLDKLDVNFDGGGGFDQRFNWKDSWMFAVGGEWQATDAIALRAGYAYEISPVRGKHRGTRIPDNDRHWLSIGGSYQFNDMIQLHAAYSHIFIKDGKINNDDPIPLKATFKQHVDIVSIGGTVNW